MLTEDQYKFLCKLKNREKIDEEENIHTLSFFSNQKFVKPTKYVDLGFSRVPRGYVITPSGEQAIEEYENEKRKEKREIDSLKVAKQSKLISWLALVVSICAIIVSVIIGIFY